MLRVFKIKAIEQLIQAYQPAMMTNNSQAARQTLEEIEV